MVSVKMEAMPTTVVLLHGFAGTRRAWDPVVERLDRERYTPLAPDLRGHGAARDARPVSFEACVADVLAAAPERFVLCGYSMGGRIAQHVALAAPERVERLVLVATTAGIADDAERAARRADDERLAAFADGATIEQFADRWTAQPLFAGTPPAAARIWREDLLRNDPRGAGRRPARGGHRRDGAAVGAPADADDAGDGPRRRRRPEVRRARRAPGGRAPGRRARRRRGRRPRPAARGARGGCRGAAARPRARAARARRSRRARPAAR